MSKTQESINDEIDLMEYLGPLLSRWKLVMLVFILGGIASFFISRMLPKSYSASASLYVQQSSGASSFLRSLPISLGSSAGNGYIVTLLQSQSMRKSVVDRLDLRNNKLLFPHKVPSLLDALDEMTGMVSVTESKSGGVVIAVTTVNPKLAADIANAMLDLLGKYVVTASKKKVTFTSERLNQTEKDLNAAEKSLMVFLEHNDVASVDEQTKQMIERLGTMEADLIGIETELKQVSSRLENSGDVDSLVELEVRQRSLIASRDYMQIQRDEARKVLSTLPSVAAKYSRLQRNIMVLSKTFELLTEQYQMAQITQKGEDGDYQIIDRARPNPKKIAPRNSVNALMGAVLSTFIACVIINIRARKTSQETA